MKYTKVIRYTKDMPKQAYEILANIGTYTDVCKKLNITEQTFYQWSGIVKYKNSKSSIKPAFSEAVAKGDLVGQANLDTLILKVATKECGGDVNLLIKKQVEKDHMLIIPILEEKNIPKKISSLEKLCTTYEDIGIDTYEYGLICIKKQAYGINLDVDKAIHEESVRRLSAIEKMMSP